MTGEHDELLARLEASEAGAGAWAARALEAEAALKAVCTREDRLREELRIALSREGVEQELRIALHRIDALRDALHGAEEASAKAGNHLVAVEAERNAIRAELLLRGGPEERLTGLLRRVAAKAEGGCVLGEELLAAVLAETGRGS